MMTILTIVGCAFLFGVLAVVRPRAGCGAQCAVCPKKCKLKELGGDHV